MNLQEVFGNCAPAWTVDLPQWRDSQEIPAGKPYVFVEQTGDILRWWFAPQRVKSLMLVGPTGCGKTSAVQQVCARLGWPLYSVKVNSSMRPEELEGIMVPESDGGTVTLKHIPGDAVLAYKHGGCLLLDEGNRAHPSMHTWLNALLEGYAIRVAQSHETITPHPHFRLILTGNAGFDGDETGLHPDCNPFCVSFQDRLRVIRFGYPTKREEVEIMMGATNNTISRANIESIVSALRHLRSLHENGDSSGARLGLGVSVRTLEDLGYAMAYEYSDLPFKRALEVSYSNALSEDDRDVVNRAVRLKLRDLVDAPVQEWSQKAPKQPQPAAGDNPFAQSATAPANQQAVPLLSGQRLGAAAQKTFDNKQDTIVPFAPSDEAKAILSCPDNWVILSARSNPRLFYAVCKKGIPSTSGATSHCIVRAFGRVFPESPQQGDITLFMRQANDPSQAIVFTEEVVQEKINSGKFNEPLSADKVKEILPVLSGIVWHRCQSDLLADF